MGTTRAAFLERLAIPPPDDSGTTVDLYALCSPCEKFIGDNSAALGNFTSETETQGERVTYWKDEVSVQSPNYYTPESMKESAQSGCHLCCLFYPKLTESPIESRPKQLELHLQLNKSSGWLLLAGCHESTFSDFLPLSVIKSTNLFSMKALRCTYSSVPSPEDFADLVRRWLHTCANEHRAGLCSPHPDIKAKEPTRLIDISNPQSPFLVTTNTLEQETSLEYVTLSHRWAGGDFFKLTQHNLRSMEVQIPYHSLTQTFRDAMLFSSALGYKYIWIDALCIIQDSRDDWARESNRMADVYRNGVLNIAVCASAPHSGFFQARNPLSWSPCLLVALEDLVLMANHDGSTIGTISDMKLLERGWVFQERVLSPRTVYVGERYLLFECRSGSVSEHSPFHWNEGNAPVSKESVERMLKSAKRHRELRSSPDVDDKELGNTFEELYQLWVSLLWAYSETKLSFQSDRLPALAAIAATFREASGSEYIAGHWHQFLPISLIWHHSYDYGHLQSLPPRRRFPSWSWASTEGPVEHKCGAWLSVDVEASVELLGYHVIEKKGRTAVLGEVETAQLHLLGVVRRVIRLELGWHDGYDEADFHCADCVVTTRGRWNKVQLEQTVENRSALLSFLTICRRGRTSPISETALILAPYLDGFVRVGFAHFEFEDDEIGHQNPLWGGGIEQEIFLY